MLHEPENDEQRERNASDFGEVLLFLFHLFIYSFTPLYDDPSTRPTSSLKKRMKMSHPQRQEQLLNLDQHDPKSAFYNALYCEEEEEQQHWEVESREDCFFYESSCPGNGGGVDNTSVFENGGLNLPPDQVTEQDHLWEGDELSNLLSKEEENRLLETLVRNPSQGLSRWQAVEWMLRVHAHFSFNALTAILAVNYFDRFLFSFQFQGEKPWMTQLAAVACLSLAAKVEETHVPLLSDLQVGETKYVFEAKTIQRMEILVLSTLGWKMNPVTPHSFIDYITRRLGFKDHLCWEFLRRCEKILLSLIFDSKFMSYLPSVIAAAAMLHVVNCLEPCFGYVYKNQLLGILGSDKDKVEECCQIILELEAGCKTIILSKKRKSVVVPGSPNGVIDATFSSDSLNDSFTVPSSVTSSPKKIRTQDRHPERFSHPPPVEFLSIPR
ncbi:hypothetical protein Dimus_004540 [Dionaea muscipula]